MLAILGRSHDCFAPLHQQSGICCSFLTFLVCKPWLQCNATADTRKKLIHCIFIKKTPGRSLFVGACPVFQSCWQLLLWLLIGHQKGCGVLAAKSIQCVDVLNSDGARTVRRMESCWRAVIEQHRQTDKLMLQQLSETRLVLALSIQSCAEIALTNWLHAWRNREGLGAELLQVGTCKSAVVAVFEIQSLVLLLTKSTKPPWQTASSHLD